MVLSDKQQEDLRRLKERDPGLTDVNWYGSGVEDGDVEALAGAVKGNRVVQRVGLHGNGGVTDASMGVLRAGLVESGVVWVSLRGTGVSAGEVTAVKAICEANKQRR